ncbi:NAD(P)H-hydrate dehydratase [Candidatus Microgenomates bacterium]|nr:NAD(P)H-hydrate dehydratase [Candidatus Microgenomates bacterium]
MIQIKSTSTDDIQPYLQKLHTPEAGSHKGQNGKLLVIGGSGLFHAASIWAAEIASHFVDMVHYSSTEENNEVMKQLKILFRSGLVVSQTDIDHYTNEDDAILIGPGMVREGTESTITHDLTKRLLHEYPYKPFVIDAGSLQMMKAEWLKDLKEPAIVTPHQLEYQRLFGQDVSKLSVEEKAHSVTNMAREYKTTVLFKAIVDIISDGEQTIIIEGGNAGLTKGGTGDILAGLVAALRTKHDPLTSAVLGSYILKRAADQLFTSKGTWYNNSDLIGCIPNVLKSLV